LVKECDTVNREPASVSYRTDAPQPAATQPAVIGAGAIGMLVAVTNLGRAGAASVAAWHRWQETAASWPGFLINPRILCWRARRHHSPRVPPTAWLVVMCRSRDGAVLNGRGPCRLRVPAYVQAYTWTDRGKFAGAVQTAMQRVALRLVVQRDYGSPEIRSVAARRRGRLRWLSPYAN